MSVTKERLPVESGARLMLQRKHEGWLNFLEEYEPYARANPDDTWAQGQVRYALAEVKRIEKLLGIAANRADRPAR
jgi:hypothetical protein